MGMGPLLEREAEEEFVKKAAAGLGFSSIITRLAGPRPGICFLNFSSSPERKGQSGQGDKRPRQRCHGKGTEAPAISSVGLSAKGKLEPGVQDSNNKIRAPCGWISCGFQRKP